MELSEAWAPLVDIEEVYSRGILVEERNDQADDDGSGIKPIRAKVYYLKSVDLFVITMDTGYWSVIACQNEIEKLRHKYLNQEPKQPVNDAFVEHDESNFTSFQSDLDVNDIEYIKKHGQFLERIESNNCDVYYLEDFDKFVVFDYVEKTGYDMDAYEYRQRFGIPFKNERVN